MKTLRKSLNDFAQDLINHCAVIKDGEITLPEDELKNLVSSYLEIDDPVIWPITLEIIQYEAEEEIERRLTDIEVNRFEFMCFDDDDVSWKRMEMIRDAILVAVDNSKHEWDEIDKNYQKEKLNGGK